MASKTFWEYFRESMNSVGLEAPQGLFGSLKQAAETASKLAIMFAALPAKATMMELIIALEAGAGAAATGSAAAAGALATTLGIAAAGISASFYIGACVGALIYAAQMTTIGEFSFANADIGTVLGQSSRYGIKIPQEASLKIIANTVKSKQNKLA